MQVEAVNRLLKQHRQMADMMKVMGGKGGKGMMGKLGQMMGMPGGGMPSPEQIAAMQKQIGRRRRAAPRSAVGAAARRVQYSAGLPRARRRRRSCPGLGGGFNPFSGKKK